MGAVTTSRERDVALLARPARARALSREVSVTVVPCCVAAARMAERCYRLPCCTADLPRATTQPLPLPSHRCFIRVYPLYPYPAAGPVRCRAHVVELVVAMPFMALRPRALVRSVCARASTITLTASRQGESELSSPVVPHLSLSAAAVELRH